MPGVLKQLRIWVLRFCISGVVYLYTIFKWIVQERRKPSRADDRILTLLKQKHSFVIIHRTVYQYLQLATMVCIQLVKTARIK